jgi:hypothetical protein
LIVPSWASAVRLQSSAGGPPQYLIDYTTGMIGLGDPSFKSYVHYPIKFSYFRFSNLQLTTLCSKVCSASSLIFNTCFTQSDCIRDCFRNLKANSFLVTKQSLL